MTRRSWLVFLCSLISLSANAVETYAVRLYGCFGQSAAMLFSDKMVEKYLSVSYLSAGNHRSWLIEKEAARNCSDGAYFCYQEVDNEENNVVFVLPRVIKEEATIKMFSRTFEVMREDQGSRSVATVYVYREDGRPWYKYSARDKVGVERISFREWNFLTKKAHEEFSYSHSEQGVDGYPILKDVDCQFERGARLFKGVRINFPVQTSEFIN